MPNFFILSEPRLYQMKGCIGRICLYLIHLLNPSSDNFPFVSCHGSTDASTFIRQQTD
jgi:hypothetical protein